MIITTEPYTGHALACLADGSIWRLSKLGGKPYLVKLPDAYDTPETRAALFARDPGAAAVWWGREAAA